MFWLIYAKGRHILDCLIFHYFNYFNILIFISFNPRNLKHDEPYVLLVITVRYYVNLFRPKEFLSNSHLRNMVQIHQMEI